jgi:uncharacterized protein (TIGR00730 family)
VRHGAPIRRALFQVFMHSVSHIERLAAAYSLMRAKFFRNPRALRDFIYWPNPLGFDCFTLQCHMTNMGKIKTVCVYCGSGPGTNPRFIESAKALGKTLAENGIRLVYGGGSVGMMGAVASAVLDHGGKVMGIIPDFLTTKENTLKNVQELIVTPDMHERKRLMFEHSDAFVAMPGGIGTLEELVEQLTWQQLGRHSKPVLLANIDGFWEPLLGLLAHMRATQFIRATLSVDILKAERAEDILPRLQAAADAAPEGSTEMTPEIAKRL